MKTKFYIILALSFLCINVYAQEFYQPKNYNEERDSYIKYTFDNFSPSELQTPFTSTFTGQIPPSKQNLTKEQKEEMRLAREEMKEKKLQFSSEEFIKQIKKNKKDNVDLMLKAGMSPNTDYFGEYAIFYAVKFNKPDIATALLELGANPNAGFDSPLFWAAKNNNTELAKLLINKGAKLDYTELVTSKSILYTALKKNNIELAKILIDKGARIDGASRVLIEKKSLQTKLGIE